MEEMVLLAFQSAWTAEDHNSAVLAGIRDHRRCTRNRWIAEVELCVSGNEKVESAIAIIIAKSGTCRPCAQRHSSLFRNIGKGPVMIVVKKSGMVRSRVTTQRIIGRAVDPIDAHQSIVVIVKQGHAAAERL